MQLKSQPVAQPINFRRSEVEAPAVSSEGGASIDSPSQLGWAGLSTVLNQSFASSPTRTAPKHISVTLPNPELQKLLTEASEPLIIAREKLVDQPNFLSDSKLLEQVREIDKQLDVMELLDYEAASRRNEFLNTLALINQSNAELEHCLKLLVTEDGDSSKTANST